MKNIIIMVGETTIGAIQSMDVKEDKDKDGYTVNVTVDTGHIRFSKERVKEAFEKGFLTAANQIYPFDIVVLEDHTISCQIRNVWLIGTDYMYEAADWFIANQAIMQAEKIIGTLNKSDEPANDADS
jgi:hypothetical protein